MITDAGTKEPRTESALVELSGLEEWQVKSGLTGLGAQGLVRELEGGEPTWEVSHDFIARAIGRLLGRLKPSLFQRARPFVAPVALILWIALIGLFIPDWLQRNVEQRVIKFMSLNHDNRGYAGKAADFGFDDEQLLRLIPDLIRLPGSLSLDLSGTKVANIEALKNFKSLTTLNLSGTKVANIDALKELKSLTSLDLRSTPVANIDALKELKSLASLILNGTKVANINSMKNLKSLTTLDLSGTKVVNIDALKELKSLTSLELPDTPVENIDALKELKSLTSLILHGTPVTNIDALKELKKFSRASIYGECRSRTSTR